MKFHHRNSLSFEFWCNSEHLSQGFSQIKRMREGQQNQFLFAKYHILYMSHWKAIYSGGNSSQTALAKKSKSRSKYSPAKSKGDEDSSAKFHNRSISRNHQSMMSNSNKDRSINKSLLKNIHEPQTIKSNVSEVHLKNSITSESAYNVPRPQRQISGPQNNNIILPASIIQNYPEKPLSKGVSRSENKTVYQAQIDKIKKEFKDFQDAIFMELRRQEKIVNEMIDKILEQIQDRLIEPSAQTKEVKEHSMQNGTKADFTKQETRLDARLIESYSENYPPTKNILSRADSLHQPWLEEENKEDKQAVMNKDGGGNSNPEKLSFNRFFQAMSLLKREMKDISTLSSIASPKSTKSERTWEAALERLKKRH